MYSILESNTKAPSIVLCLGIDWVLDLLLGQSSHCVATKGWASNLAMSGLYTTGVGIRKDFSTLLWMLWMETLSCVDLLLQITITTV